MPLLAIETSCDETAVALLEGEGRIRASRVRSQVTLHAPFGGVVPELASRHHLEVLPLLIRQVLEEAEATVEDLEAVAVTAGPGLIGALLVGVSVAKGLAYGRGIPLIPVHHLEGHLWAPALEAPLEPPFVALIVSGGHTQTVAVRAFGHYQILGRTLDDAAGEAFDKVARLLGLGFPGGPALERMAREGDSTRFPLPRALATPGNLDFSFSGLKTAVIRHLASVWPQWHPGATLPGPEEAPQWNRLRADLAASFQAAVVESLVEKTLAAARRCGVRQIVLTGGVACNQALREGLQKAAAQEGLTVRVPSPRLCTDNAAMIAWVGWRHWQAGVRAPWSLNPDPRWPLGTPLGNQSPRSRK